MTMKQTKKTSDTKWNHRENSFLERKPNTTWLQDSQGCHMFSFKKKRWILLKNIQKHNKTPSATPFDSWPFTIAFAEAA